MSRSGQLFSAVLSDDAIHYGTSPVATGAGSGEGGNPGGTITPLGALRDTTVPFVSVGTEDNVHFIANNNLDVAVTITYQGFIGTTPADLANDAKWTTITAVTVAAGGSNTYDVLSNTYNKIRATVDAVRMPGIGGPNVSDLGSPEFVSQQLDVRGNTQDQVKAVKADLVDLGTLGGAAPGTPPEFLSQQLPLRGDDQDARRNSTTLFTGSAVDGAYALPTLDSMGMVSGSAVDRPYASSTGIGGTLVLSWTSDRAAGIFSGI